MIPFLSMSTFEWLHQIEKVVGDKGSAGQQQRQACGDFGEMSRILQMTPQ